MVMMMRKRPEVIQPVYNDGFAKFYDIIEKTDEWGTPIRGEFEKGNLQLEIWFRYLGITAQDVYYAKADDENLTSKIAVRGNIRINTKWQLEINDVNYQIYRTYFNPKNNESELSLVEVSP